MTLATDVPSRADAMLRVDSEVLWRRTDRLFAKLMVFQYLAGIAAAIWVSPRTWAGSESSVHAHVWAATLLGGIVTSLPVVLAWKQPGRTATRHVIATAQALTSALLIHLCGGRIETHFHVFGSLAFLAFYRDWRVLVTATVFVTVDHMFRGLYWPQSVFGVLAAEPWRWLEHSGWVLFEDVFLIHSCVTSRREMVEIATRRARLEFDQQVIEAEVVARTAELREESANRRQAEEFSAAVLQSTPDPILVITADGIVLHASASVETTLGWAPDELVGENVVTLLPDPGSWQIGDLGRPLPEAERGSRGAVRQVRLRRRDTELIPAEITVARVANVSSAMFVAIVRDLSARVRLERELEDARRLEAVGQLAAGVAHEINTPTQFVGDNTRFLRDGFDDLRGVVAKAAELAGVVGEDGPAGRVAAELRDLVAAADLDYLDAEIPRAIEQSLEGIGRVRKIVQSMKEFSHPGTEAMTNVDLNHAIEATVTVATSEWKYVAEMVMDFDADLPPVPCLPGEINQVVLNMIVNAAHAIADVVGEGSGQKGKITITTRREGDVAVIQIADTGGGIPETVRERIFEPFFTTKEIGKGTGQGLAIAHGVVVKKHRGVVDFETEAGKGTTFVIRLPLSQESGVLEAQV